MRLFICIELSKEVKKEIKRVEEIIREKDIMKLKFVNPQKAHLTLKFLGEKNKEEVKEIKKKLRKFNYNCFKAKLGRVGYFTPKFLKVLWMDLKPNKKFSEMNNLINNLLGEKNKRQFSSHVTLARVKNIKNKKDEIINYLDKLKTKPLEFKVKSIKLKNSRLTPKGPEYEDIAEFGLKEGI